MDPEYKIDFKTSWDFPRYEVLMCRKRYFGVIPKWEKIDVFFTGILGLEQAKKQAEDFLKKIKDDGGVL